MKFNEKQFLDDALKYIEGTYDKHYVGEDDSDMQIVEFWQMMGNSQETIATCRNVATKYLARYGRKEGRNIQDLYKAIHYLSFMAFYTEKNKITDVSNQVDDDIELHRIPMANPEK